MPKKLIQKGFTEAIKSAGVEFESDECETILYATLASFVTELVEGGQSKGGLDEEQLEEIYQRLVKQYRG